MTKLLERAVAEAARLSESQQNAVAARWLDDLSADRKWEDSFAATTDADLDNLIVFARSQAADAVPADDLLRRYETSGEDAE
jgi:hypothetical protein